MAFALMFIVVITRTYCALNTEIQCRPCESADKRNNFFCLICIAPQIGKKERLLSLTSSLRFSHLPHGLSSKISLSSSESSPLSRGDLRSFSKLLPPDITPVYQHHNVNRTTTQLNYITPEFSRRKH